TTVCAKCVSSKGNLELEPDWNRFSFKTGTSRDRDQRGTLMTSLLQGARRLRKDISKSTCPGEGSHYRCRHQASHNRRHHTARVGVTSTRIRPGTTSCAWKRRVNFRGSTGKNRYPL